jgi:hypothetical protein
MSCPQHLRTFYQIIMYLVDCLSDFTCTTELELICKLASCKLKLMFSTDNPKQQRVSCHCTCLLMSADAPAASRRSSLLYMVYMLDAGFCTISGVFSTGRMVVSLCGSRKDCMSQQPAIQT